MKVIVAIDSFKGSLSSVEAGKAAKAGILAACPNAYVIVKPLADGGEGTTDALIEGMNGERRELTVTGPFGTPVQTYYGYLPESNTVVMEMASAAGITLTDRRDPLLASTFGVGEMILDAVQRGCRNFIIGIGGSITNDGGIGMLKALGFRFLDKHGNDAGEGAQALERIDKIITTGQNPALKDCFFQIACDVTNPLCGENGATYIYGAQKGVTGNLMETIDRNMAHYAEITNAALGCNYMDAAGAGAAGGLGFAFLSYLNSELTPGIDLVLRAIGLESDLADADFAVTGEGQLDHQTAMGKAPVGVARIAKKTGTKVIAFAGSVTPGAALCNQAGIDAFFPIVRGVTSLEEAMNPENAKENMKACAEQVFRLLR